MIMIFWSTFILVTISVANAAATLRAPNTPRFYTHESVPGYRLSVTDPAHMHIDNVKQKAGYISTPNGANLFYWFFESRNKPSKDPIVLWMNGGPGCSSLEATLFENGPAFIQQNLQMKRNEWSWNNNASVIYLDQPAKVGYSTGGENVDSTVQGSRDFTSFVRLFFESFPEYKSREFHIAGESYCGRYIPVYAEAVNTDPDQPVRVHSVMIGNGIVDAVSEYRSYEPFLCGQGGFNSVLNAAECEVMQASLGTCLSSLRTCEQNGGTGTACGVAQRVCSVQQAPWRSMNPYDVRDSTCEQTNTGLCYPGLDWIDNYFNQPSVKQALGVDNNVNYQVCNDNINLAFNRIYDGYAPTIQNITNLLHSGVSVLAYHGDKDIILNWLSGRYWTASVPWDGQQNFQNALNSPTEWTPARGGEALGTASNFGNLTFLRVFNAGHMVPHDQPEAGYRMLQAWLSKDLAFERKQNWPLK